MATDARAQTLRELLSEFIEERVRQMPDQAFSIGDVTRALSAMLMDAGQAGALAPSDNKWLAASLDHHPFLLRSQAGSTVQWKPGLNKGALAGDPGHR